MTEKERYIELCAKEPSICAYDQPWWMDAVCGEENWDVLLYEKNGVILGALPYYLKEKYGLRYITQPRFTQHNGVWIKYPENQKYEKRLSYEKEVISALIEQLEALPICYYRQSFSPEFTNWLPFYWKGYHQTTSYTYRLPCKRKPLSEIEKEFAQVIRYDAKKAQEFVQVEDSDDVDTFYALNAKTFERQGQQPRCSLDFLRRLDNCCKAHGERKIYLAKGEDGAYLCGIYLLCDANTVYYLMSGTDTQYRKFNALTLLLKLGIQFAAQTGRDFDFEGSMVEPIEDYFRKFGGTQTPYFSIQKTYTKNPLLRAAIQKKLH